jgi:glycerol-3-phosphate O-acyltransferase
MGPAWPSAAGRSVLLLTERMSSVELQAFDEWLETTRPPGTPVAVVHIPPAGRLDAVATQALERQLARDEDVLVIPVGAVWTPPKTLVPGRISPVSTLLAGDWRRPRPMAQKWLSRRDPGSCELVLGQSATLTEIRERFAERVGGPEDGKLAPYVSRQATLSLERTVIRKLGPQYKIPRLVKQEVAVSARFQAAVERVAAEVGQPVTKVRDEAVEVLDELVTGWGRLLVDMQAQLGRWVYPLGYDEQIEYDASQVDKVRDALAANPGVILMSHRSHLDGTVLPVALAENGLPRAHLLGGINMSFWPLGPLMRRAGVIFIRREFRDDQVYKMVLREYVAYLVEKRFHLQWAIEGTRSRTGKMEPPKLGLLAYVVDALRDGRAQDVVLVPVSIAYDQIHEVSEFATIATGGKKQKEGLGWMVGWLQAQKRGYGKIYISFADPISVKAQLGDLSGPRDPNELHKLAFEVAWRMNQATPITGSALLTTVLLGVRGKALTLAQVRASISIPLDYAQRRNLPLAASAKVLATDEGIIATLDALSKHNVVTCYPSGVEPVWMIDRDHYHAASFYRNSLIHFFLDAAISELALLKVADAPADEALEQFWAEAYLLRDLLKFDFFFPDRDQFRAQLGHELDLQSPGWEQEVKSGRARAVLEGQQLLVTSVMLSSFLEGYGIVADVLKDQPAVAIDAKELGKRCLDVGRQYLYQERVHSSESVSSLLFKTGVQLAASRNLLRGGHQVVPEREAFSRELSELLERTHRLDEINEGRLRALLLDGTLPPAPRTASDAP